MAREGESVAGCGPDVPGYRTLSHMTFSNGTEDVMLGCEQCGVVIMRSMKNTHTNACPGLVQAASANQADQPEAVGATF